jgi:spermidine/putrescine transport system substrate-binding protein
VVHGYSNDIYQADLGAQKDGKKFRIRHSLPKEGAVLALDAMVISKSAPRPDLAVKFINFMLEGRNSADLTNMIGSGKPQQGCSAVHQAGDQADQRHLPGRSDVEEARDVEGHDARATARAESHLDRDQSQVSVQLHRCRRVGRTAGGMLKKPT